MTPETTAESDNAISEVNQNSQASSYALLCNANVLEWTNVERGCNSASSERDDDMKFSENGGNSGKDQELRLLSFAESLNDTCTFPSVASSDDIENQKMY